MSPAIVDTNVAVIANDQNDDVVDGCKDNCKRFLIDARANRTIVLDDAGLVLMEYIQAISTNRPHGLGARFLIDTIQTQFISERCKRVTLRCDANGSFTDFPADPDLANFDASDRKFAALSRLLNVPVTNATDSDWANFQVPLAVNGILVEFLCGANVDSWFKE